jgi:hypothetical protein
VILADNTTQTVLIRDDYTCQLRLSVCDRYATLVVPKPGVVRGLKPLRAVQLQAVCRPCAEQPQP